MPRTAPTTARLVLDRPASWFAQWLRGELVRQQVPDPVGGEVRP